MIQRIEAALNKLTTKDDLTLGTSELVESIKAYTKYSYKKIGEVSGVTEQGVRRWRENDSGQASRVQALVSFAHSLIAKPEISPAPAPFLAAPNAADAIKGVTPLAVQTSLKEALEGVLGISLTSCSIVKLEPSSDRVKIEFIIQ